MRIALGSDHGGFDIKEVLKRALEQRGIEVDDVGCFDKQSVDYPDYALEVAMRVVGKSADEGMLVCTTGLGMAMTANKFPQIRAALCCTPEMAVKARTHNNANILVIAGGLVTPEQCTAILEQWLANRFSNEDRHSRRVGKIGAYALHAAHMASVLAEDPEVFNALYAEEGRQQDTINLIASENYVSPAVLQAQASVMTNKYAEGYPGKRWYQGCVNVDRVERLAIDRAMALYGAEHANVQPHCGSSANMGVYFSVLKPGDKILAMKLDQGGHLTHGNPVNFSGRLYRIVAYGVSRRTECIDYDEVARIARAEKPAMIVAGASSYPRTIDFARFREIADSVGAFFMVDMAHIAGLVAGGCHASPVPHADFVTTTTHKTLRGPRAGMVLCRRTFADDLDKQVFPGVQGGPLMHTIAAKAVCLHEAMQPAFKDYAAQIVRNAAALADALCQRELRLVTGGTDNHLMLVDLNAVGVTGKVAAAALETAGIVANKNVIPFDTRNAFQTSGIRLGTPAVTTRGMKEPEMARIADLICRVLRNPADADTTEHVRGAVLELTSQFPVV